MVQITKKKIQEYRDGGEGMVKWCQENVYLPIPRDQSPIPRWIRIGDLPRKPLKQTGRSWWELWENQSEEFKEALQMMDGDFIYKLIVFCWMRGEGKSLNVVLIQLWKYFNFPRQQIVLGANSKDQSKFVHYDFMKDIILNSPNLLAIVGKRNIQEKSITLRNAKNEVQSEIKSISAYSGIVSNITGYTFSEMFDMQNPKFFVQLDGSARNIPLALGTIDSTVSAKDHQLYRLYDSYVSGADPLIYFSHRSSPNADYRDFWHPRMTQKQLDSYKAKFPPLEFDRYFRNTWEVSAGKLFSSEMIDYVHIAGIDDAYSLGDKEVDREISMALSKIYTYKSEIDRLNRERKGKGKRGQKQRQASLKRKRRGTHRRKKVPSYSERAKSGKNVTEPDDAGTKADKVVAKKKQMAVEDAKLTLTEGIEYHKSRFFYVDELYKLDDGRGKPTIMSAEKLNELGDLFDTDWVILTGLDRSDPMAIESSARTIITALAKGLPGSRSERRIVNDDSSEYVYFMVAFEHIEDASLRGIKETLQEIHDEYNGIDVFCSERWGVWDLKDWCEDMEIEFEAIFPSYANQKSAFSEVYQSCARGLFKTPYINLPGSQQEDLLEEEMEYFDYNPDKKWYGSPQKEVKNGVQDDSLFAIAWTMFGGRNLGLESFRKITPLKEMFGIYYPSQRQRQNTMMF